MGSQTSYSEAEINSTLDDAPRLFAEALTYELKTARMQTLQYFDSQTGSIITPKGK